MAENNKIQTDPETEENVDFELYSGRWFEIARIENFFERKCGDGSKGPIAEYELKSDGSIGVTNSCCLADSDVCEKVSGVAIPLDSSSNSKLQVSFIPIIKHFPSLIRCFSSRGNYWILKVVHREDKGGDGKEEETDKKVEKEKTKTLYDLSYVGSPDRSYLWLLSRTETVSNEEYEAFLKFSKEQGYDISKIVRVRKEVGDKEASESNNQ